ncbi:MAG: hypothetical protein AB1730_09580 [Myxococcota bacterium]
MPDAQHRDDAGFEVLSPDATDDGPARAMSHALELNRQPHFPWNLETELFSHYTLVRRKE